MVRTSCAALLLMTMACATAPEAAVQGTADRDQIRDAVRARLGKVQSCYDAVLARRPGVAAAMVVDFTIGADGRVTRTEIGRLDGPDELGQCVATAVATWTFPRPSRGTVAVSYPLLFAPS